METASRRMGRIELDGNRPLTEENAEPGSGVAATDSQTADLGGNLN